MNGATIYESTDGFIFSVIISLDIKPRIERLAGVDIDFSGRDAYEFAKKLEDFIRKRFVGVRNFHCSKNLNGSQMIMHFNHMGYNMREKDISFRLLENELKIII